MLSSTLFEDLQSKIDKDTKVREELKDVLQNLERQGRKTQSVLSRAHSTQRGGLEEVINDSVTSLETEINHIKLLGKLASAYPYYKYNSLWTRDVQTTVFSILFCGWLGGFDTVEGQRLLTIERVGEILGIPVNVKDEDTFHLTIEEYLQGLISLVDELARLAVNSVTLGDFKRPLEISRFAKDIQAGFQLLNLKNDNLRRRSDGIKYSVKKIEDVVYDLSLRNLIPKD